MALVRLEILSRQPLADTKAFGDTGPYDQVDAIGHFAVDPALPLNDVIADIGLAPRNAGGLVEFSADVRVLLPAEPVAGNRRLFVEVPNRGNRGGMRYFNRAPAGAIPSAPLNTGDGFLMRHGYTVAWCGWQHDVPGVEGLMRAQVPEARVGGETVRGPILVKFQPVAPSQTQQLSDRLHQPYPAADLEEAGATLTVRDFPGGPATVFPRDQWSFTGDSSIFMASGFEPGRLYQAAYTTAYAPVVGLGLIGTRDLASFLRYATAAEGNPCAGTLDRAYLFGASQSGRHVKEFLYLGLNEDEGGRLVYDGVIAHICGTNRGGDFNMRFGQPSADMNPKMSNLGPWKLEPETDPVTGIRAGLLDRLAAGGRAPKVFLTNSSTEYWRGDAALTHITLDGKADVAPPENQRIYHFAGTHHAAGSLPLTRTNIQGQAARNLLNSVDYSPLLRAALVNLDRWASEGRAPPESNHPRLDDGTAVAPATVAPAFAGLPGVEFPTHIPPATRLDFGPESGRGIATVLPPAEGESFPVFVPSVDSDGNELPGIHLPDVGVPLATYMGWNLRDEAAGGTGQMMALTGSTLPFAATRAAREARGDPRLSIQERYASRDDYVERVRAAAVELVAGGYLLEEDVAVLVDQGGARYDAMVAADGQANLAASAASR